MAGKPVLCGLCHRRLKRKDIEADLVIKSSTKRGVRYCPARDTEKCHRQARLLRRLKAYEEEERERMDQAATPA